MRKKNCKVCEENKAKRYNRRILIQKKHTIMTPERISKEEWTTIMTLWAFRKPLTTRWREFFQAEGMNAAKIYQYEIRYREGISESMRLVDRGRIHDIKAVLEDANGDRTESWIMAEELTNG